MNPCRTVLVVEDDIPIQQSLRDALEFEGYSVATADNGQEALDLLKNISAPCIILLDLMMPVMDGWEFLKYRSEHHVLMTIPVVVVTAATDKKIQGATGVQTVIKKPIDLDILISWVKRYCERQEAA